MKSSLLKLSIFSQIILISITAYASSVFMATKEGKVLVGRNADWDNLNVRMIVQPPSEGKYGIIYLGAKGIECNEGPGCFIMTTGMNDKGLWYGSTSLYDGTFPRNDIINYYNKPTLPYNLLVKALEECATVDEVIEIFSTYFTTNWNGHHQFIDKEGNSVIIEFGERDVICIRRTNNYQVMTNFPNADTINARWYNCYRYRTAESMLSGSDDISIDFFRTICDAVHQEGNSPTSLSTIFNPVSGDLYVYYFHNYDEVLVFNLFEELAKGENYYIIPDFYNQIKLKYPTKGEYVSPISATFTWYGNVEDYNLYYSTDPNFRDAEPIRISTSYSYSETSITYLALYFGLMILSLMFKKKKKNRTLIIGFIVVSFLISCENIIEPPFTPSTIEHCQTVENLQMNTLYYWKVVAIGTKGINSESTVQTFKTYD